MAFLVRFDRLGRAAFVFGSVALFFTTRSLAEYFMVLVAVWAVSSLTTSSASFAAIPRLLPSLRSPRWLAAVLAPALVVVVAALTTPPPLSIKVVGLRTNGQLESVWRVRAVVVNHESRTLRPHFEANYVGQATSFFHILRGPHVLDPGQRATYVLAAPNRGSMPGVSSPFTLVATTARPATLSVSSRFVPQTYSADLEPSYLNTIVRPGQRVVFHVVLRSPFGAYVHKAGVRVALGQVIYGQDGLVLSQARINGAPEGRTPVYAVTNRQGRATFVVRDNQPQAQPLYFQAWVATHFPGGYSGIVSVLWKRH